jgi:electron transfer flavoprotein alpha subunit
VAVLGTGGGAADLFGDAGADRLLPCDPAEFATPARAMAAVKRAADALYPRHVLFGDDPVAGGDLARRWAVRQRLPVATAVVELKEAAIARRVEGGTAEHAMAPAAVLALRPEAGVAFAGPPHEATLLELDPGEPGPAASSVPVPLPLDPDAVPLGEAEFVVAAGNGVADFAAFHELARALGAVKAGSRVVCDAGHLPRDRQVGASGTVLRARCYLALGIAGAPQHLQGIPEVEHVVAVNTDLHAAMVKRAGLAVVADARAVMPALIQAARLRRRTRPC